MSKVRGNEEWIQDLEGSDAVQEAAIEDLRAILVKAAAYTFQRNLADLSHFGQDEIAELAEDCAQDALVSILKHLEEFRGDSKFTTWAYKFAVNISLTMARRERWKGAYLDSLAEQPLPDHLGLFAGGRQVNPEFAAVRSEIGAMIMEVIRNELTEKQRMVLKWMVFDEVPMDVVVEKLDTNRNAVYKLLHDARRKLKTSLLARGVGVNDSIDLFAEFKR